MAGLNALRNAALAGAAGTGAMLYSPDSEAVVKLPGGNWLTGSIEGALKGLRRNAGLTRQQQMFERDLPAELQSARAAERDRSPNAVLNSFIDRQLADYVRNRMASPKDELRLMADAWPEKQGALLKAQQAKIDKARAKLEKLQRERPGDPLPRSVAELNALEGGLEAIKARQALHMPVTDDRDLARLYRVTAARHQDSGGGGWLADAGPVKQSEASRQWEAIADASIEPGTYSWLHNSHLPVEMSKGEKREYLLQREGQIAADNPNLIAHRPTAGDSFRLDTGFRHLTDELYNALTDPNLPEHLRINPDDLGKYSMEQAVNRVADIDAFRAVKKAEADKIKANNAAVKTMREYPEGYRWVEFTQPKLPKGYKSTREGDALRVYDAEGREIANFVDRPDRNAEHQAKDHFSKKTLQDALDYEADVMQHCVRGYCDRVTGGQSRILSLRDAEGRPHVTVEVNPGDAIIDPSRALQQAAATEIRARDPSALKDYSDYFAKTGAHSMDYANDFMPWFKKNRPELYEELTKPGPSRISQIKGPRNARPDEAVLQYVQDLIENPMGFTESGRWADDIEELRQAGFYR